MILLVGRSRGLCDTVGELLQRMGYISEQVLPEEAEARLCPRHHAVLLLGRRVCEGVGEFVGRLRAVGGNIPIYAIRDDFSPEEHSVFDGVYANSVFSAAAVGELATLAVSRGLVPIGEYISGGIDARVNGREVKLCGEPLGLTRTEAAVLRYLIAVGGEGIRASEILTGLFRPSRRPTEASVRTHISSINKKATELSGHPVITSDERGYALAAFAYAR